MPLEVAPVPVEVRGRRVVLLVGGGIAAYKVADLASQLVQAGCQVRVAMTSAAIRFIGPPTFHGLTGNPVLTDLWDPRAAAEPHVSLGDWAQLILIAPATANLLSRLAAGASDDIVTATALAARCPVVVAPAMNDAMWAKPAVTANVEALAARGIRVVEPAAGNLASGHRGTGRLAAPGSIFSQMAEALRAGHDLAGRRVVVTAGGTREAIDPVRFIGNHSSGKMGAALAQAAAERGADVVLVTTASFPETAGVAVRQVESAAEMLDALKAEMAGSFTTDLLLMVAAVADFRPSRREPAKIRREERDSLHLDLERNVDILAELARDGGIAAGYRVGFAAEDTDLDSHAVEKLGRKGLDAIVANDITGGVFGSDENAGVMFFRSGERIELLRSTKRVMAERILDLVRERLP